MAEKSLNKINPIAKDSILSKLKDIKAGIVEGDFCKLHDFGIATHRLRIGKYRLILKQTESGYIVLDIGHWT